MGTCLSHPEQEKPCQVVLCEKSGTKSVWDCDSASVNSPAQSAADTVPLEKCLDCARLWGAAFLLPHPPLPHPKTLPLTHPGSCSRAAFLEVRGGPQSLSQMPNWRTKFVKPLMIRCGRFESPLWCVGTSPFTSEPSNLSADPDHKGGMYCAYKSCSSAFILNMYVLFSSPREWGSSNETQKYQKHWPSGDVSYPSSSAQSVAAAAFPGCKHRERLKRTISLFMAGFSASLV